MHVIVAVLQLLIGLAFVSISLIRRHYGAEAKASAEAEVERQGIPTRVLTENKITFDEKGIETAVPAAALVIMAILAVLNFSGSSLGVTLTWIIQPLVIIGNGLILYSQVTAVQSVSAYFAKSSDEALKRIDVKEMLEAAEQGFPRWVMPYWQNVRHTIAFAGSAAVLILLAIG